MGDLLPVFAVAVLVNVAWTLLVRTFPAVLGAKLLKKTEHQYSVRLSRVEADLNARYSTLKTSVDVLSASQTELRSKTTASVQTLWTAMIEIEREFGDLVFVDDLLLREEIRDFFASGRINKYLGDYRDSDAVTKKVVRLTELNSEADRLFSGERLWLLFATFSRTYARMCGLIQLSFEKGSYLDWRTDQFLDSMLRPVLSAELLDGIKQDRTGGLRKVVAHLKAEFLKEAVRVMSGSQHIADSLSDLQATLLTEQQKLTTNGPWPESQ